MKVGLSITLLIFIQHAALCQSEIISLDNSFVSSENIHSITKEYFQMITKDSVLNTPTNKMKETYNFNKNGYLIDYLVKKDSTKFIVEISYDPHDNIATINKSFYIHDSLYQQQTLSDVDIELTINKKLDLVLKLNPYIDFSKQYIYPKSEDLFFGDHWKWLLPEKSGFHFRDLGQSIKIDTIVRNFDYIAVDEKTIYKLTSCDSIQWLSNSSGDWEAGIMPSYDIPFSKECYERYKASLNSNGQYIYESYHDYGNAESRFRYYYGLSRIPEEAVLYCENFWFYIKYRINTLPNKK